MTPTPEPQTLTVEEAARILGIGRTAAYALAREWRTTDGRSGLPVLELGRSLRVPRAALARLLDAPALVAGAPEEFTGLAPLSNNTASRRARGEQTAVQGTLWPAAGGDTTSERAQAPDGAASSR